jgi:hypothetical protein
MRYYVVNEDNEHNITYNPIQTKLTDLTTTGALQRYSMKQQEACMFKNVSQEKYSVPRN